MKKLALLLGLMLVPAAARAQDVGLPIGTRPPAVKLQDINGHTVDLAQYIGKKPLLLEFWATWCPLCRALEPQLKTFQQKYGSKIQMFIVAVGVNQSVASIKRHLANHPVAGTVLWDGDGAAVRAFEAPGTSYIVMLDANGRVVYTGAGSDQKLLAVMN